MCEAIDLDAYRSDNGGFDFQQKFSGCKDYLSKSDYVVGNLETPIANEALCNKLHEFNAPIEFAEAVKASGFSLVTTANNHCLDRDVKGLIDTIGNLDKIGLKHIGTNDDSAIKDRKKSTGIVESFLGGQIKVGFLSYTYGTNAYANNNYLDQNTKWMVNLFQEQELHNRYFRKIYKFLPFSLFRRVINKISRSLGYKNIFCHVYERTEKRGEYFDDRIKNDIELLKEMGADYIIMCLHIGGQYNVKPLAKTNEYINTMIDCEVDAVIGNHEHVVHPCKILRNKIKEFALGNFTGSAGTLRRPYNTMSDYSILFNIYLSKNECVEIEKCSFAIAKNISIAEGKVGTVLLYDLISSCLNEEEKTKLLQDNLKIYNLFKGVNETNVKLELEYLL
jgi:poly-gamma-glutamate synthesis protein (capsule biosynthesis protein)